MSNIRESSLFGAATIANHEKQKIYPRVKFTKNIRFDGAGTGT